MILDLLWAPFWEESYFLLSVLDFTPTNNCNFTLPLMVFIFQVLDDFQSLFPFLYIRIQSIELVDLCLRVQKKNIIMIQRRLRKWDLYCHFPTISVPFQGSTRILPSDSMVSKFKHLSWELSTLHNQNQNKQHLDAYLFHSYKLPAFTYI